MYPLLTISKEYKTIVVKNLNTNYPPVCYCQFSSLCLIVFQETFAILINFRAIRARDMEAIEIASFFQQTVNRLRVWRGLSEHIFSQDLYDRSLEACSEACHQDLRTTTVVAGYGFGQHVSRV